MSRKPQLAAWALGALAAVAMVVAAAGATLTFTASRASAARAHKASVRIPFRASASAREQFRANVEDMLSGLRGVVVRVQANPATAKNLAKSGTNLLPMIAAAKQQVTELDPAQLAELKASVGNDPNWQQAPSELAGAVAAFDATASDPTLSGSGTFTDDCSTAGDPYAEDIAALAANEVQSGLYAVIYALPGVFELAPSLGSPDPAKIAFAVAWGVANGVYLALAQTLAVAVDCEASAFSTTQSSTLPQDSSNNVIQTSSQLSITNLINKAGDTKTKITGVKTTVNTVQTQTDMVDTAVTALNNILNDITNRVDDVQTDLQTLQARVGVLQNTEVTILKKADTEIANLGTFQSLQLRMDIEANLAKPNGQGALGVLQLPAAFGGYLEVVRSIVTDTLAKEAALGNPNPQAVSLLNAANAAFAAGQYKAAYTQYTKAYGFGR